MSNSLSIEKFNFVKIRYLNENNNFYQTIILIYYNKNKNIGLKET